MSGFSKSGHEHKCTGKYTTEHFKICYWNGYFKNIFFFCRIYVGWIRLKWWKHPQNGNVCGTLCSLRKHPFLHALRRWGRFVRRNVCDSATEIPYWFGSPWLPDLLSKHWFASSVWNFSQTFLHAKRPYLRRARRNGYFRRLHIMMLNRAQLFEGRLALNPELNLTLISFSCVEKHSLG